MGADLSPDNERIARAAVAHFDGVISDEEMRWLSQQFIDAPGSVSAFVEMAQLEMGVEQLHSDHRMEADVQTVLSSIGLVDDAECGYSSLSTSSKGAMGSSFAKTLLALACMLLVGATSALVFRGDNAAGPRTSPKIAQVVSSVDALWKEHHGPDEKGWLPDGAALLQRGQVEILFSAGAKVVVEAPAEFYALTPVEAQLIYGKMIALVDGKTTDFSVHTPTAEVIDLGTEFGLSVDELGETAVAVFDGMVDVAPDANRDSGDFDAVRRLTAGEGLRVDRQGTQRRIRSVVDDTFPTLTPSRRPDRSIEPPLIAGIRDNLRDEDSPKFYRVVTGGLREDALAYVDRPHQWNGVDEAGIPEMLVGADYIMPFNDDKYTWHLEIELTFARPATVYVLFDDRGAQPAWLTSRFEDTGLNIGVDEANTPHYPSFTLDSGAGASIDRVFSVWRLDCPEAGSVQLGPRSGRRGPISMYGIAVVPLESEVTTQ